MKIRYIVLLVMLVNAILGMLISLFSRDLLEIITLRSGSKDRTGNYILPGFMGPSFDAYAPYVEALSGEAKIVRYGNYGFNAQNIAAQIVEDIKSNGYTSIRLISISMGDKIAQYVASQCHEAVVVIYAINPCTRVEFVKAGVRKWLNPVSISGLKVVRLVLGLLSYLPIIPKDGLTWSFAALVEQANAIACESAPIDQKATVGVVVCQPGVEDEDEFLDNSAVYAAFQAPVFTLEGHHHADIINSRDAYLKALRIFGIN